MTSPGYDDSSRHEPEFGDMSLPPEQRRHLLELESSFCVDDTNLGTVSEAASCGTPVFGRVGDMGPPPLPAASLGIPGRSLRRAASSISNHSRVRSSAPTPTIAANEGDMRERKISENAHGKERESPSSSRTSSPLPGAHAATSSPTQTPLPSSETDGEPHLSSSPTVAAQSRNNHNKSLAAAFVPATTTLPSSSTHAEPSPEEIGLAIDRRPSAHSLRSDGSYGNLRLEGTSTSIFRSSGTVRTRILSTSTSTTNLSSRRSRPKLLRSRHSSQRSSLSSINDMSLEHGDDGASTITAGEGGGILSRSTSLGSIASGITGIAGGGSVRGNGSEALLFNNMSTAAERALARLDEEEKNSRRGSDVGRDDERRGSPSKEGEVIHKSNPGADSNSTEPTTPKTQHPAPPAPTDTAITAQVKSIHVPGTVAREYRAGHLALTQPPGSPSKRGAPGATPAPGQGKNMTLKEQSTIIDRLQKENFDLKIKVFYLNDKLEKQSDEGIKEMMKENVDMKIKLAEGMRERKSLKRMIKELEKKIQEMGGEREGKEGGDDLTELWELKERVERYEVEIEELSRREKEREDRIREEIVKKGPASGDRAEEVVCLPKPPSLSFLASLTIPRKCCANSSRPRRPVESKLTSKTVVFGKKSGG